MDEFGTQPISFDLTRLADARRRIPADDLVDAAYDHQGEPAPTTDVLIVFSTPRSGSTWLCELLLANQSCIAHEYFQPAQYLPLLAQRWGCLAGNALDEAAYVGSLRRFRTCRNGWLGINLHGSHLSYYARMERHLGALPIHYVHLVRRDAIAQAISYHVASHSGAWSSQFDKGEAPPYDYARIARKLAQLQSQNLSIQAFLQARGASYTTIYYEELAADPGAVLRQLPCVAPQPAPRTDCRLRRQADERSEGWARRFAEDFLRQSRRTPPLRRLARRVRRLMR